MKYRDMTSNYVKQLAIHRARLDRIKKLEQRIQKLGSMSGPSWISEIVEPLAKELASRLGMEYEILGPFGICSATSIHFFKKGSNHDEAYSLESGVKSLTFIPIDLTHGKLKVRDESIDTGEFKRDTIGDVNGMNHPSVDIPESVDLEWFIGWVR